MADSVRPEFGCRGGITSRLTSCGLCLICRPSPDVINEKRYGSPDQAETYDVRRRQDLSVQDSHDELKGWRDELQEADQGQW